MLLSVVIKNLILIILILLSIHFFLNILISNNNNVAKCDSFENQGKKDKILECKDFPENISQDPPENISKDLNKECTSDFPVPSTCSTNLHDFPEVYASMKVIADCNLEQNKKDMMLLKEYEDETTMNGGVLYDGLNAFDTFDYNYESYTCNNDTFN
jgi:hypothetical protein